MSSPSGVVGVWATSAALAALVAGCGGGAAPAPADLGPGTASAPATVGRTTTTTAPEVSAAPTPLDGTYEISWEADELAQALGGEENPSAAEDARMNSGTIVLVFDQGRYDMRYERDGSSCPGTFVVTGERVVMTATTKPSEWECGDGLGDVVADARWTLTGDTLALTEWKLPAQPDVSWFSAALLGTKPLQRQS